MCGIAGLLGGAQGKERTYINVRRMTDRLHHRGPDASGCWVDETGMVGLGHRRLAIVDLSDAGAQPMSSICGRYTLVFNGEIYNCAELRTQLRRDSAEWRGHSDTEVLLYAIQQWGLHVALEHCAGMFALALWDHHLHKLSLARDRMGEKPLYYGWQGSGIDRSFLFGSELKALKAHPSFDAEVSLKALASFTRCMVVPDSLCIYEGIDKVPPGGIVSVTASDRSLSVDTYWSLVDIKSEANEGDTAHSDLEVVAHLEQTLLEVISEQINADVPLGAFLSGGVDSSTVVALMQHLSARKIKTFSIGFTEPKYNEAHFAKAVAQHLNTDHTEVYLSPNDALSVIPKLPKIYCEPFADSSQIPTLLVSEVARRDVTVALTGDGADELFGGYNRHKLVASAWPYVEGIPLGIRKLLSLGMSTLSPDSIDNLAQLWGHSAPLGLGDKFHKAGNVLTSRTLEELYENLVSVGSGRSHGSTALLPHDLKLMTPRVANVSDADHVMIWDLLNYLPSDILTKVDRAAMSVSLETRVPFLDHRVVEVAMKIRHGQKIRKTSNGIETKWALRQILYKHCPRSLIERPKAGFGIPLEYWLRGPLREWAEDLLDSTRIKDDGFFAHEHVRNLWEEHLSGKKNNVHAVWPVLMFQSWLRGN